MSTSSSPASVLAHAKRLIIKTGSALIADANGNPYTDWLADLATDIAGWREQSRQIILVTSGAMLEIQDQTGAHIAKGITAYPSTDIALIAGKQSDQIEALLGGKARRPAIIHRDDLALSKIST